MASTSTSDRGEEERDPFLALECLNKMIKSSLTTKGFDAFINHRGPDTKDNLAKPIYHSLHQAGIRAYLDVEETELGDYFPSAIKNAIFSATVHIAILSPRYAESAWCLAELALMFQTKARIIPLFYHIHPSNFRHIINEVKDAFSKHEEKGRYSNHDIQLWKECLQNVSGIKGFEFNGQNEDLNKVCNEIVSAVVKEKQKTKIPFQVAKHGVGLVELARDFYSHCRRNGEMRDKIIGIYGMGGSGKTTLAKYLFNEKHSEFSGSTILFDVRENYVKGTLISLQKKLLNELFHGNQDLFSSTEDGMAVIIDYFQKRRESRFLVVIDDVDHEKQLDALLPIPIDVLNPNSLVIVTTRDERLLRNAGVRVRYKMKKLNPEHSRQLFCYHAFHGQSCKRGFENLVDGFVKACGGLPLSLRVMGGHVFGSGKGYWELQLDAVKARLDKDIKDTLKISYDSLEEDEKQIFMDIACFFIGEDVSMAISIWKASGWRAEHALQILRDKCLVQVDTSLDPMENYGLISHYGPEYILRMHDHLRDLGRAMADDEKSHSRRLWRPEDHIELSNIRRFQDSLTVSEGKSFRYHTSRKRIPLEPGTEFYSGHFLEISKTSTNAQWLSLSFPERDAQSIPEWIPLQNLHSLHLYGLSPARLLHRDHQVSLKLKQLHWSSDRSAHVNKDMFMTELVSSFGIFKHLESLHVEDCWSEFNIEWNRLLKSLTELNNLKTLKLIGFIVEGEIALRDREETSDHRYCMRSLEAISLFLAFHTRKVSIHGQFCPALKSLKLCWMFDLIEVDLTGQTTLESLALMWCAKLRQVLVNYTPKLEVFRMTTCPTMTELPNFGRASCLKRIYISCCTNLKNISGIERLNGLKRIWIADCPQLKSIEAIEQLKGLTRIWVETCPGLEGVICFKELKQLRRLFIGNCKRLQNIQGVEFLIRLERITITGCPKLQNISGIEELKGLKEMIIAVGPMRTYAQRLQRLPSELTILVGRSVVADGDKWASLMSDLYKIGDTLPVDNDNQLKGRIEEMMDSFHETKRSLSTMIFCALLSCLDDHDDDDDYDYDRYPRIWKNICTGTRFKFSRSIPLWSQYSAQGLITGALEAHNTHLANASSVPVKDGLYMLYTCVVNEDWLSKYESWQPSGSNVREAFMMGVEAGEERKALQTLQRLFAQHCVDYYNEKDDDHDELAEYVDEDEKYDGSDDDD